MSVDSVVLPVPDSPKKSAVEPLGDSLAEQCMGKTSRLGKMRLRAEKIDFFISPAYSVLPISTSCRSKSMATTVLLRQPWRSGSALKLGRSTTNQSGWSCGSSTFTKRFWEKRLCQAYSVTTRTLTR